MTTTEVVRELARNIVDILPPPVDGHPHAVKEWERTMLWAAAQMAAGVDYDVDLLEAAIGPPIQVGRSPAWRVLLSIALIEAQASRPSTEAAQAVSVAQLALVGVG